MWAVKIKRLPTLSCDIILISTGAGRIYILFFSFSPFSPIKAKGTRTLVFYAPFWPFSTHSRQTP